MGAMLTGRESDRASDPMLGRARLVQRFVIPWMVKVIVIIDRHPSGFSKELHTWTGALPLRATQRLHRAPYRPARELAAQHTRKVRSGRRNAELGTSTTCRAENQESAPTPPHHWHGLRGITPELSCKGIK